MRIIKMFTEEQKMEIKRINEDVKENGIGISRHNNFYYHDIEEVRQYIFVKSSEESFYIMIRTDFTKDCLDIAIKTKDFQKALDLFRSLVNLSN